MSGVDDERLRLKRQYSIVAHSPDEVELRHGVWNPISYTVRDDTESGRLLRLVSRLDGSLTPAALAREEGVAREEVEGLLDHLQGLGVLEAGPSTALEHYLDAIVPWRTGAEARPGRPIVVAGDERLSEPIAGLLRQSLPGGADVRVAGAADPVWALVADPDRGWLDDGLATERRLTDFAAWADAFVICAQPVVDPGALHALNRLCLGAGVPWLHAAIDGPFLFVGPVSIPSRSPCYECLEIRITMNLRESASYQRYKRALAERQVTHGSLPLQPLLVSMLASHTAMEALNFVLTGSTFTIGKLLAIYLPTMEFTFNEVLRAPTCSACAPSPVRDDTGLYFDMGAFIEAG